MSTNKTYDVVPVDLWPKLTVSIKIVPHELSGLREPWRIIKLAVDSLQGLKIEMHTPKEVRAWATMLLHDGGENYKWIYNQVISQLSTVEVVYQDNGTKTKQPKGYRNAHDILHAHSNCNSLKD